MALIAVASAKGSPGVTTTALLLGALWPRPVLVAECDPSGGDVAVRMPGDDGKPLAADRGLLSLAAAARRTLAPDLVRMHAQTVIGGLDVLLGVQIPEQAAGVTSLWGQLAPSFAGMPGLDVVADLGRIAGLTPQNALLPAASDVILVCTVEPSSVVHLRNRVNALDAVLRPGSASGARLHVIVVGDPRRSRPVTEIKDALARLATPVTAVHHLAHDSKGAGFFNGNIGGNPARTTLVRSAVPIAARLAESAAPFFVEAEGVAV